MDKSVEPSGDDLKERLIAIASAPTLFSAPARAAAKEAADALDAKDRCDDCEGPVAHRLCHDDYRAAANDAIAKSEEQKRQIELVRDLIVSWRKKPGSVMGLPTHFLQCADELETVLESEKS